MFTFNEIMRLLWWSVFQLFSANTALIPDEIARLPKWVSESSGIVMQGQNHFWTMNDGGGSNVLYSFSTTGEFMDSVSVKGAGNVDWEELSADKKHIYIGDFGNNLNDRKDLRIYILDINKKDVEPAIIRFSYADQMTYPATANFDMEAMICMQDSLFLFSKNKLRKGTGYSKLYKMPAAPGSYVLEVVDSVYLGLPVTGAAINASGTKLVLMSYGAFFIFEDFRGNDFFSGKMTKYLIPLSQTEAVAFISDHEIIFSNEQRKVFYLKLDEKFLIKFWK